MKRCLGPLIILCIVFLIPVLHFNNLLAIHKVVVHEGIFNITKNANDYVFDNLRSYTYNIFLRFYKDKDVNYSNLFMEKVPYIVEIELIDSKNNVIKKETINQNSRIQGGFANDYFEWRLMFFLAKRGERYRLRIICNSDFEPFDTMKKTIYVETLMTTLRSHFGIYSESLSSSFS